MIVTRSNGGLNASVYDTNTTLPHHIIDSSISSRATEKQNALKWLLCYSVEDEFTIGYRKSFQLMFNVINFTGFDFY